MKIIGFAIDKISAEKKKVSGGKVEIKNNLLITDITEDKVEHLESPILKFDFSYAINYEPGLAEIKLTGSVIGLDNENESKTILKDWKDKKFNSDSKIVIINYIMGECTLRALNLEKELNLPLHVSIPKLKKETSNPANYTG